jgi:hypothetical protein
MKYNDKIYFIQIVLKPSLQDILFIEAIIK